MNLEIISRLEAMRFLAKPQPARRPRVWNGSGFTKGCKRRLPRHNRGPGAAGDYINYGVRNDSGKLVAVARIGPAPYGNAPVRAAVGEDLAPHTAYLMRQCAVGISQDELQAFIRGYLARFRTDMLARNAERSRAGKPSYDFRYLLSLDDPRERLIETPRWGVLAEVNAATGRVYLQAGALDAGETGGGKRPVRYITSDGEVRATYRNGRSRAGDLARKGLPLIYEGRKRRFVWVLAARGTPEYAAWRRALPAWVKEPVWGQDGLGWIQPRLLWQLIRFPLASAAWASPRIAP